MKKISAKLLFLFLFVCLIGLPSLTAQSTGGGSTRTPANFVLKIVANPANAQIFIDGKPVKGTDFTLPAGTHTVEVKAAGFQDFSTTVNLTQNMTVTANLQPLGFKLSVQSPVQGAQVFINNNPVGKTNYLGTYPPGNYQIRVTMPGFEDFNTTVALKGDTTVNAPLKAQMFKLTVQSPVQGAQVFVNNNAVGKTNFIGEFAPGNYAVRVSMPGYQYFKANIVLKEDMAITAALNPILFTLTVQSPVQGAQVFINKNKAGVTNFSGAYAPGTYSIQVSMPGFQDFITTVNLTQNTVVDAALIPLMAKVVFAVPQNIQDARIPGSINQIKIFVDGKPANLGPNDIPPGSNVIRITSRGVAAEQTVVFQAGQTYNVVLNFGFVIQ
jgi:uncharacterized membrane protein YvbJ